MAWGWLGGMKPKGPKGPPPPPPPKKPKKPKANGKGFSQTL